MDINYKMIGADGQQYGPVTMDQLKDWIREGRVTAATQVLRSDVNSWLPAMQYTELGLAQVPPITAPGAPVPLSAGNPAAMMERANLVRRVRSGANWFFFIGGFSLINSFMLMRGSRFLVGLGITDLITAFTSGLENGGMAVGLALNLMVVAVFVAFGIFARKGHSWAFVAGLVCYALDGLIFLVLIPQTLSLVFHVLVLVFIFMGLQANIRLKALQRGAVA